jgi:ABC-type sugar transport system ATPase subunit
MTTNPVKAQTATLPEVAPFAVANHISKRFFATQALDDVTVTFNTNQVHALIGENGAGKSTLIKIFGGIHQPDGGQILINEQAVKITSPSDALDAGIIVIPQEMQVVATQTVAENVLLGQIPTKKVLGILNGIDKAMMHERCLELLRRFYLEIDPDSAVGNLSFAERQIIMIARALNHEAKFLILDEPTAALETREVERLFEIIERLKGMNVAVAFISHRLDEVESLADVCTIFRDGKLVSHDLGAVPGKTDMARLMTGRDLEETHHGGGRTIGETLISLDHPGNNEANATEVTINNGEIIGLAGLLGGGMTEFLRETFGAGATPKTLSVSDFTIDLSSPADAIRHGIGLVPAERSEGLIMGMTVRENIVLPNLKKFTSASGLDNRAIETFVSELIKSLDIRPGDPNKTVRELSGGNQQKVIFARWLTGQINVLLLDEPTHGVDVGAKAQIHRIMSEFAEKGGGIIFASSELTEVLSISDNVLAMRTGEIVAKISRDNVYNEKILRDALEG